ncbi:MAG: TonB family protein [Rhizomicrobium sp.]|nr:TonB family protein [Rhizomicrobium sp.]
MLKRTLFACLLATGAAQAADTPPMLLGHHECIAPPQVGRQEAKVGFTITESGAITDMHIIESSGSADADARVMKCIEGYSYKPATHNGIAVAAPFHENYRWARLRDMEGDRHAFGEFERDIDHRCHKLYPVDRRFFVASQPLSLVNVTRLEGGEVHTSIVQSAGEKADKNAIRCIEDILKDHSDLPAVFSRSFQIDWWHHTVEGHQ